MVVSRLRQWRGSRRLFRFAAGLTLVAVTAGGIAATGPAGSSSEALSKTTSASAPPAIQTVAGRSVESAGPVASGHDRVDAAPFDELREHLAAGASPQRTAARDDAQPLVGVAYAPSGLRAPPLHLS